MKVRSLVLFSAALCSSYAVAASLAEVKTVYLLPMAGGLDQYLANQLTQSGRIHVVTDPQKAEAIFTDRLGTDFEDRMQALYPPPAPPKPEKSDEEAKDKKDASIGEALSEAAGTGTNRVSSFSRGKGNVFLVDRETRRVIWSHYLRPRTTRSEDLDRAAGKIVGELNGAAKRLQKNSVAKSAPETSTAPRPAPPAPAAAAAPAPPAPAPAPKK